MTMDTDNKDRSHHHHHHHTLPTTTTTNTTTSSTTGELFICFSTSRLSSSMKISSSKSILSPGRRSSRDQISLSASLSRRLRTNGSIKGGQASPMFPAGGKKRGGSFENPEPSSPKVTCIGQVRVKTKKQSKKMVTRSLSRRRSAGAEVLSFKRLERGISDSTSNGDSLISGGGGSGSGGGIQFQQYECLPPGRNQRWVHLPVTICDALRAFGSEFNCFLPCRSSSCLASGEDGKEKEEKSATAADAGGESGNGGSCGAVFARWMVAVQEKDVKGREIDMVVRNGEEKHVKDNEEEEEEEYSDLEMRRRSYRRHHGFEEIDLNLKEEDVFGGNNVDEEGEIKSRMSICVPPKNALLLMRCRSDPVKMAALANKFWNPPDAVKVDAVEGKVENGGGITEPDGRGEEDAADRKRSEEESKEAGGLEDSVAEVAEMEVTVEGDSDEQQTETKCEEEEVMAVEEVDRVQESAAELDEVEASNEISVLEKEDEKEEECQMLIADEAVTVDGFGNEEISDLDNPPAENNEETMCSGTGAGGEESKASEEEDNGAEGVTIMTEDPDSPMPEQEVDTEEEEEEARLPEQEPEKPDAAEEDEEKKQEQGKGFEPDNPKAVEEPTQPGRKSKERESQPSLPDCLLLMMCEPKVSMEVSKETWVCSTDFVRWLPEPSRQVAAVKKNNDEKHIPNNKTKKISSVDVNPPPPAPPVQKTKIALQFQPPRSSCSYPARPPAWRPGAELIGEGIEQPPRQSVGKSKGYEPLMLKRCKSEPRKTAAKLAPEACCWKNRKLEPQLRIGAAGVGF
ncbi:mdn1 [Linum perenne]